MSAVEFYGRAVQREVAGEDYSRNRQKDKEDALGDAIQKDVEELILTVLKMIYPRTWDYPGMEAEGREDAISYIKKYLR